MTKTNFIYALSVALIAFIADVSAFSARASPKTPPQAPVIKVSAYEEALPMLYYSKLVYNFADIIEQAREGNLELELPRKFPVKDLGQFMDESLDLTKYNRGRGLTFGQIYEVITLNYAAINAAFEKAGKIDKFAVDVINDLKDRFEAKGGGMKDEVFLSTYRSLQNKVSCVYGVIKDERNKRVIITFRGSQTPFVNQDWQTNFDARMQNLRTPKKVQDKMKGKIKERVLVHEGFFNYLFNNKKVDGDQKYDQILNDIRPLVGKGYSVYVTGHSLGAALATLFSFTAAGGGENTNFIPRPLTCITYAAPFSGASSYRAAFEQEELDGLIRCLRINNGEDIVPALPPFSIGIGPKKLMKHCGLNLRLIKGGFKTEHTTHVGPFGGVFSAMQNSIMKPIWNGLEWHLLPLHETRLEDAKAKLEQVTIDQLYKDPNVVGKNFLQGIVSDYDENEEGQEEL